MSWLPHWMETGQVWTRWKLLWNIRLWYPARQWSEAMASGGEWIPKFGCFWWRRLRTEGTIDQWIYRHSIWKHWQFQLFWVAPTSMTSQKWCTSWPTHRNTAQTEASVTAHADEKQAFKHYNYEVKAQKCYEELRKSPLFLGGFQLDLPETFSRDVSFRACPSQNSWTRPYLRVLTCLTFDSLCGVVGCCCCSACEAAPVHSWCCCCVSCHSPTVVANSSSLLELRASHCHRCDVPAELRLASSGASQQAWGGGKVTSTALIRNFTLPRQNKELLLQPVVVSRNQNEKVLIEASVNSLRISIKIKQADDVEQILVKKFARFMMQRAENFVVLRRKPIQVRCWSDCLNVIGLRHQLLDHERPHWEHVQA